MDTELCAAGGALQTYSKSPTREPSGCKPQSRGHAPPRRGGTAARPRLLLLRALQLHRPPPSHPLPCSADSAPVCQPTHHTAVLLQALNREIENALFIFACLLCIICVKSVINISHYSMIWPTELVGYLRLTLLGLHKQIRLKNLLLK